MKKNSSFTSKDEVAYWWFMKVLSDVDGIFFVIRMLFIFFVTAIYPIYPWVLAIGVLEGMIAFTVGASLFAVVAIPIGAIALTVISSVLYRKYPH